jgi:hypothetical protein
MASADGDNVDSGCLGNVTFRMVTAGGDNWVYSSSGDEEPNWLTLFNTSGTQLPTAPSEDETANCEDGGAGFSVPIGSSTGSVGDAGAEQVWDPAKP